MNDMDKAIEFYALNTDVVKMLVLYSNNTKTKIVGRALIWKLSTFDGVETDRYFMDRIYTSHNYQDSFFMKYAENHKYLRKTYQTYNDTEVYDTTLEEDNGLGVVEMTIDAVKDSRYYPYLDTFKYINPVEKILSSFNNNEKHRNLLLDETDGSVDDGRWIEFYGRWFHRYQEDLIACYITDDKEDFTIFR